MSASFWIAHLFLLCIAVSQTESRSIDIDLWTIPEDRLPYSTQIAEVGDTIVWHESMKGASDVDQLQHSVTYHPSGDCSEEGKKEIPRNDEGSLVYIFTESDARKSMFFTSDIGYQCELGMQISVIVNAGQFPAQRSAGDDYISDQIDALSVETTPNPTANVLTPWPTGSPSILSTLNPTTQSTPSPTPLPTIWPAAVPTQFPTPSPSLSKTLIPTTTPTPLPTAVLFPSQTLPSTQNPTSNSNPLPARAQSQTPFPTFTPTPLPTFLPTPMPTSNQNPPSSTPRPTSSDTPRPTSDETPLPTTMRTSNPTPLPTPRPTANQDPPSTPVTTSNQNPPSTPRPTSIPTPRPTSDETPRPTTMTTSSPTPFPTPRPTSNETPLSTPMPTSNETPLSTPRPTSNETPLSTPRPTSNETPLSTPRPASNETPLPTPSPTSNPTPLPTLILNSTPESPTTRRPAAEPSPFPTRTRTPAPSIEALATPIAVQSFSPSAEPSASPISSLPTTPAAERLETTSPTIAGTNLTFFSSMEPSASPTLTPSFVPSDGVPSEEVEKTISPTKLTTSLNETDTASTNGTVTVIGNVTFSIVVRAGNLEDMPFTAYSSQLIVAVDSLALDVVERLDTSLDNNQNRYKLRQRILDYLEVDVQIAHQQRFLEPLRVNLPGSITQVQTSDFTSTPQVSASQIFLGGACPSTFGNPEEDRCEIITASIGLLVGEGFVSNEIQDAFQAGLDAGVTNGRLQFFLKESYPESRVKIISGEVILDRKNDASMSDESDFDVSSRMSPGAIVGIVLVVLVVLIAIYFGVVTRYCCLKNIRRNDPRRYRIDKETMDVKTLSEKSWLALSDREGGMVNDDPNDWSIPTNVAAEKPEVVFLSHDLGQFVIPLDDYLSNASVEESKDSHSKDGSIVPGKCSADGSSRTAIQMTDGSVMSGKCSANRSVMSGKYSADGSSRSGIPSKEGSVASGLSVGNSSSLGSSSTAGFMSGNRVVDLHGGRFRDHVPEVDKMEDFEANILAAIQTGDWEAVGVTAAVLASQHDSSFSGRYTSLEEQSRDCSTRGKTWQDVIDATKAAELDQLIEQGNWAGIIDAAARYESETMEIK